MPEADGSNFAILQMNHTIMVRRFNGRYQAWLHSNPELLAFNCTTPAEAVEVLKKEIHRALKDSRSAPTGVTT